MVEVNPLDISIRPATAGDEDFLRTVHRDERHWEFEPLLFAGDEENYHKVMRHQFEAQQDVFFNTYDVAKYGVVQWTDTPIGRLYLDYRDAEVRVLDIALLEDYRGRKIGSILLRGVCADAARRKLPVTLHVHVNNPLAYRFYYRLGFEPRASNGRHILMEWFHPDYEALQRGQFIAPEIVVKRRLEAETAAQQGGNATN